MLKTRCLAVLAAAAALSTSPALAMGPGRTPTPTPSPAPSPRASYDLVIEVFRGDIAANERVPGALVEVDSDSRTSDGSGFTHFHAPEGVRTIKVTAPGYLPLVTTHAHTAASSLKLSIVPPCFTAGPDVEPA
ncbi:MAG TPA: hypothetical protein VM598_03780, partial [Bdellovibrionota bacterium]|nr:hypothetical protein [Bdellovibrionota bacterium]